MIKKFHYLGILLLLLAFAVSSCSQSELSNFQEDDPAPEFNLLHLFDGYPSLKRAWDSVNGITVNEKLADMVKSDRETNSVFMEVLANLLGSDLGILEDLKATVGLLIDSSERFQYPEASQVGSFYLGGTPEEYLDSFYGFLDEATGLQGGNLPGMGASVLAANQKLLAYVLDQHSGDKLELEETMQELVDSIDELERADFVDLMEFLSTFMVRADYPMYLDSGGNLRTSAGDVSPSDTNLDLGNIAKGIHLFLSGMSGGSGSEPIDREEVYDLIETLRDNLDSGNAEVLKYLICQIEDHFTKGGAVYGSDLDTLNTNPNAAVYNTNSSQIYSNAELAASVKELLAGSSQLFMRSDRPNAMIDDKNGRSVYPMELLMENLDAINFDAGTAHIKESLYDLIRFDVWGRDRKTDPTAWPTSHLESLVFLTIVSGNIGWNDGGTTGEITASSDPNYNHGHGSYIGRLSLNDSLISIKTKKTMNALGMYDISFRETDRNDLYRSRTPFTQGEVDTLYQGSGPQGDDKDYRFWYNQNYDVLNVMPSPCIGDAGSPDGGNPDGDEMAANQYRTYNPTGREELHIGSWSMGLIARACWNGEGPYYYAPADAPTLPDGRSIYYRPNGRVYAYVDKSGPTWIYEYPVEDGDEADPDDAQGQRFNRYRAQWDSDYYMSHYSSLNINLWDNPTEQRFRTIGNSSGDLGILDCDDDPGDSAGRLTYYETVPEEAAYRACESPEEALYRNYQWLMTEKKMVMIMPLVLKIEHLNVRDIIYSMMDFDIGFNWYLTLGDLGVVYQVLEANGISGLGDLRKFGANHEWAKKGDTGLSTIPGDYRIEVAAEIHGIRFFGASVTSLLVNAGTIYNDTLDCGHANPSILSHNLPAIARLAFPRSGYIDRGGGVLDKIVGSQDFVADNSNPIWNKRNVVMPILVSLISGLHEYTVSNAPTRGGIRSMIDGLAPLGKPLVYYQKDAGAYPRSTWKPRVYGTNLGTYQGNPYLMPAANFYSGTPTYWYGSDAERRHYQPAQYRTLLNILTDRNPFSGNLADRCNGILSKMLEYTVTDNWEWETPDPTPSSGETKIYEGIEQIMSAMKYKKEAGVVINETNAKNAVFPGWMFTDYGIRDVDVDMDEMLDDIVGHDDDPATPEDDGTGIAALPDDKPAPSEPWEDFDEAVADLYDMVDNLLMKGAPYCVTENLLDVVDLVSLSGPSFTDDEIKGLMYTMGKMLAYYDTGSSAWKYQGDEGFSMLYNLVKNALPAVHDVVADGTGENYYALLKSLEMTMVDDGLMPFIVDSVTIVPYTSEDFFNDLYLWLNSDLISSPTTTFYGSLSDLLRDMGDAILKAPSVEELYKIYEYYGFDPQ